MGDCLESTHAESAQSLVRGDGSVTSQNFKDVLFSRSFRLRESAQEVCVILQAARIYGTQNPYLWNERCTIVEELVALINSAYSWGEAGMWNGPVERTNTFDVITNLQREKLFVAYDGSDSISTDVESRKCLTLTILICNLFGGEYDVGWIIDIRYDVLSVNVATVSSRSPLGCVLVDTSFDPVERMGEFGMLAVREDIGRAGLGGFLIQSAELWCKVKNCTKLRLELLSPLEECEAGPRKERMEGWYQRLGYKKEHGDRFGDFFQNKFPDVAQKLAVRCRFDFYTKDLVTV